MPDCKVIIQVQEGAAAAELLRDAWIYWRAGGNLTLLRTNHEGRVFVLNANGDRTKPWEYDATRFTTQIGAQVDIYFSRGTKPIPDARLNEHLPAFHHRTVNLPPPGTALPGNEN